MLAMTETFGFQESEPLDKFIVMDRAKAAMKSNDLNAVKEFAQSLQHRDKEWKARWGVSFGYNDKWVNKAHAI